MGTRIGRIRVDALLGTGGMGEVYRGWDEKLERAVALKVVHADKRVSAAVRGRFLREARVLSQLDHPNICRIYDVLEREDGDYLVLELVDGDTLREHIARITKEQSLDVALQVARVLATTHARGIVHRDLKPDNIMLTPSGSVKVLDFGLARSVDPVQQAQRDAEPDFVADDVEKTAVLGRPASSTIDDTHTSAGSLVGTLHYMSPEQARGLPLNEASDIYSLGVVLHEVLSGGRKVYGEVESMNDLLVRVRRAEVDLSPIDDRAVAALLKRMLALYPADRPTAEDVARELERIRERPLRRRRRMLAVGAIALLLLGVGGISLLTRYYASTRTLFERKTTGRIAILPFRNETGDASLQWIERGLADFVSEGLRRGRGLEVVSSEDVARVAKRTKDRQATLAALGADVLIQPTVVDDDGRYTIRYAALTADREEEPREATSTVLMEAAKQMTVALVQRIDPAASAASVRSRYSLDNTSNMLYAMGLEELRRRGPLVASHYFTLCIDRDPAFLAAQMHLADCLKAMAENTRANALLDDALKKARQRNDRDLVARAFLYRAVWSIDDGTYRLGLTSATEALSLARALGDRELEAQSWNAMARSAWRLGDLATAKNHLQQALRIANDMRDPNLQSASHNDLGLLASSAGDTPLAKSHFRQAMAIAERTNDLYSLCTILGNVAMAEGDSGDFARAEELTRRQLALAREIRDTATEIIALTNLGLWQWAQGHEPDAVKTTEEAARVAARVGNPRVEAIILANLGTAHAKMGNLAEAARFSNAAAERARGLDDPEVDRDVHLALAYTRIREGRLDDAARDLDLAEAWQKNGRTRLMRGRLAYARGDFAIAVALAREAKATGDPWLIQNEAMLRGFEESVRTARPATVAFEGEVR
jgi:tRNA A-37 threonylcarbamoyl transferase component Bud32/tetratricopeptide (TPR) repeat protein